MNNRGGIRSRILAVIAAIGLTIGVVSVPQATPTQASWLTAEHGRATMTSLQLQAPIITGTVCEKVALGLLLNRFEISWRVPEDMQIVGQTPIITWQLQGSSLPSQPTTTGPVNGVYTSTFGSGLLTELLTLLLGGEGVFVGRLQLQPMGWTSQTPSTVELYIPPLLGSPTCPWTNAT